MADTTQNVAPDRNAQPPKTAKPKPNFQRPKNKTGKVIPQPTHLSRSETTLTNDPLWKDSFIIDGEIGFCNEDAAREFEADAAGYIHLVESEYKAISDVDKYYAKSVTQSAHTYFHVVLYWYEIALIAQKNGRASIPQERLVQFVQGYGSARIAAEGYVLPDPQARTRHCRRRFRQYVGLLYL